MAVAGQEDVLGLQVAVDDPSLVGGRETAGDLDGMLDRPAGRQPASQEGLTQCLPLEQL